MIDKTIDGQPLSEEAKRNLALFRAVAQARAQEQIVDEHEERRLRRNGVKVFTDEEKARFLAERSDLA